LLNKMLERTLSLEPSSRKKTLLMEEEVGHCHQVLH
jgi:hypothetical protein